MGGPGGAGPKPNLSHAIGQGALQRADDFYYGSACVNCHQSVPQNTCTSCHTSTVPNSSKFSNELKLRPSPCNAEMRWPQFLQEGIPNIQTYPWWIEQNFLSTKLQKTGNPINPQKIDFGIEIFLKGGESFAVSDYRFETQENSKIIFVPHLAGKGENLSMLLEGQKILELQNIRVKPNSWYGDFLPNNWLQEIGIQDGHPFLRAAIGALNLFRNTNNPSYSDIDLQEHILPVLPIAYHTSTGRIYLGKDYEEVKKEKPTSIQIIQSTFEIYENKQFPHLIKMSDLLTLIQDFAKISDIKKKNGSPPEDPSPLSNAVSSVVFKLESVPDEIKYPNFYAKFHEDPNNTLSLQVRTKGFENIQDLNAKGKIHLDELFIPGIIHLDNTLGNIQINYTSQGEALLDLDNIHANLRPFDYFKENPRKLGALQILEGQVQDGTDLNYMGFHFPPGIHVRQKEKDHFVIQANLSLNLKINVPVLGTVQVSIPFVFQTDIQANPLDFLAPSKANQEKIKITPQNTLLFIPDLFIKNSQSYNINLLLTDIPYIMSPPPLDPFSNGFWLSTQIDGIQNTPFKSALIETFLPLESGPEGYYNFAALEKFSQVNTQMDFELLNGERVSGDIDFLGMQTKSAYETHAWLNLDRQDAKRNRLEAVVKNLYFNFNKTDGNDFVQNNILLSADSIGINPVHLQNPLFQLNFSKSKLEDGSLLWTIQDLNIEANRKAGANRPSGILRGPILIRNFSKPKDPLQIVYNQENHRMQISNLALRFDLNRISIPNISQFSNRAISGIDLDGRINGTWNFDTETYAGRGRIVIRGDKEGDIHFRGKDGRRLEAALDPNEPNRYYQTPLLADTKFIIDRIQALDMKRDQIKGHFHLSTLVDWLALKALGIYWNEHDEFTFDFDHLPYSAKGYAQKIREFFTYIANHPVEIPKKEVQP